MTIEVYNIYGALLLSENVSEHQYIDISELSVGAYTVLIKADGLRTESKTLIKMK